MRLESSDGLGVVIILRHMASVKSQRDPSFNEHEFLKEKAGFYGYQPVRVAERGGAWTYSCSQPPGHTFTFDELPREIRDRVHLLECVEPYVTIPGVGMRLSGTHAHFWLAMPHGYGDPDVDAI